MDTETTPTQAQQLWVYALDGLYNDTELSPSERRRAERIVASNEISLAVKDDFAIVASYLLAEYGRWRALQTIYRNFTRHRDAGGQLDEWYFIAMAEFAEIQRLVQREEFETAIVRGCSFTEHYLDDNVDWFRYAPFDFESGRDPSFAELINFAQKAGFITNQDQKLLHFVREVRNHTAHHAWLKKNIEFDLILLASRALLYLINQLIEEKAARDDIALPEFEAESEFATKYIKKVEDDFGWTYHYGKQFWITSSL